MHQCQNCSSEYFVNIDVKIEELYLRCVVADQLVAGHLASWHSLVRSRE